MSDVWIADGDTITSREVLDRLRHVLDTESALIVEHRFYRGSSSPWRFVCEDVATLEEYLRTKARAGDSFYVWSFEDCCREDNTVGRGKIPDSEGRVPLGGAY